MTLHRQYGKVGSWWNTVIVGYSEVLSIFVKGQTSSSSHLVKRQQCTDYISMRTHLPVVVNLTLTRYRAIVLFRVSTNPTIDTLHPLKAVFRVLLLTNAKEYILWCMEKVYCYFPIMSSATKASGC